MEIQASKAHFVPFLEALRGKAGQRHGLPRQRGFLHVLQQEEGSLGMLRGLCGIILHLENIIVLARCRTETQPKIVKKSVKQ